MVDVWYALQTKRRRRRRREKPKKRKRGGKEEMEKSQFLLLLSFLLQSFAGSPSVSRYCKYTHPYTHAILVRKVKKGVGFRRGEKKKGRLLTSGSNNHLLSYSQDLH